MTKVKFTADMVLSIIKGIFADNDIDNIEDGDLQGKSLQESLDVEYYTFKHRPESTEQILNALRHEGKNVDELLALKRAFGCLTLGDVSREPAKDIDNTSVEATLDFWLQTDKIKLLELLIEKANANLSGLRIPVLKCIA